MIKNLYISSSDRKINKRKIHKLVGLLKKELAFNISLLFINFINSEKIQKINKKYLNHNYSTDIITFNYSGSSTDIDGEIIISIQDALTNARKYKVSLSQELTRLVIHGILHLKGFDDVVKNERRKMKQIENHLTIKYNFALLR